MNNAKEQRMQFETQVINTVGKMLDSGERADFYSGTLFVTCNEPRAHSIFRTLCDQFGGVNRVRISQCGEEYAYDFVG
jgi:hypothetical protein